MHVLVATVRGDGRLASIVSAATLLPSPEVPDLVSVGVELLAVGDPGRTRTVYAAIAFLVAIGVGLLVLAGWLVRSTRVDRELLAPLELMGERSWRAADPVWQRRRLDEVRPAGAEPLVRMAPPPDNDPEFERGPVLGDFSDFDDLLRDLGVDLDEVASTTDHGSPADASGVEPDLEAPSSDVLGVDDPDVEMSFDEPSSSNGDGAEHSDEAVSSDDHRDTDDAGSEPDAARAQRYDG